MVCFDAFLKCLHKDNARVGPSFWGLWGTTHVLSTQALLAGAPCQMRSQSIPHGQETALRKAE